MDYMSGIDNDDLKTVCEALNLQIPLKLFTLGDLRSLKSAVQIF